MRLLFLFLLFILYETEKLEHFENDPLLAVFFNQLFYQWIRLLLCKWTEINASPCKPCTPKCGALVEISWLLKASASEYLKHKWRIQVVWTGGRASNLAAFSRLVMSVCFCQSRSSFSSRSGFFWKLTWGWTGFALSLTAKSV